mgnify:CR=1 FL=1
MTTSEILDKNTLKEKWHLDGPFEYALEARPGTAFGNACTGGFLQPTDNADYKLSVSSHGPSTEVPIRYLSSALRRISFIFQRRLIRAAP